MIPRIAPVSCFARFGTQILVGVKFLVTIMQIYVSAFILKVSIS